MARRDYYAVLGVKRTASPEEIKRSFRALAMEFHPDRNPDDPEAERRFRDIAEAYQVLGDAEQRSRYDRLGPFYRSDGRPPSQDDLNAFVADTLSTLFRRGRPKDKGEDLRYTLTLSLEEVTTGTSRDIEVRRRSSCRTCEGTGAEPDGGSRSCDQCDGSGKSATRRILRQDCPRCEGRGTIIITRCKRCDGAGARESTETLKVRVPAGVATGQKLRLRHKGNAARDGGATGDLFVIIAVEDHVLFRRRGADLFCEVPILWHEATLGADIDVPTLEGRTSIRVPPGTPSHKVFKLTGRGLKATNGNRRGDLHIKVVVEVPPELAPGQADAVRALAKNLDSGAHPRRRDYDALLHKHAARGT